ncbi:ABC transporter substrate-binding protein [Roseburia sp. 499]|uniref:ABC transporter substrate-binding protein n=1 Tax=Roseburia sp. 499 TaxID=1261634 RepID=UPI0009524E17|nr:ABC transporter substrate-binding protein [Roseburia sp. 499]WVK68966.1 ABC transporter substrate-binding protein [Roseburia sp. 499]
MKKRLLAALLGMTMVAGLLTGCGSNGSKEATKTADGKIQIDFWYSGGKTAVNVFQDIVDDFNASQDKYEIVTTTQADYTETYEKLQAGIAGNNAPDMALLDVDKSRNLSEKNLVADLSKFIDEDSDFQKDDYLSVFFDQGVNEDGKTFALPAYGTTQIFYYNIAAFEKAGIDPESIQTWQDLAEAAAAMTSADGSFVGWEPMWGSPNLVDAALSNGASLLSEDGKTVMINSEEWVEVWESFRQWIHDDKIMKVNSGGQGWEYWYTTIDDVLQNKAGGYTGSSGDQADLDFSIVAAMEQPGFNDNPSAPTADALQLVMLEDSDDETKQGVYEFMKYFTSPENQAKWSMATGYVAVRQSTLEVEEFKAYTEENPQALVPISQASHGTPALTDPTGGKIFDALSIAADKVELENVPAKEALDEAQKTAQEALDSINK